MTVHDASGPRFSTQFSRDVRGLGPAHGPVPPESQPMATLRPTNRLCGAEAGMSLTNGDVAKHAYELAERSRGLPRMAALCVSVAAATTDTICRARAALEIVPHS